MELTWYGLSCFRFVERGAATIVTDPFSASIGLELPKLKGDVVTVSHDTTGHNNVSAVSGVEHVLDGPGEYEIGNVFVNGVLSPRKNLEETRNVMYVFEYDDISVAHLGDLDRMLTQSQIDALGQVNVLIVPIGGGQTLTAAKAAELVSLIEPNVVIPMHYAQDGLKLELSDLDRFLKEMGVTEAEPQSSLKVTKSGLSSEGTQVVVLDMKG